MLACHTTFHTYCISHHTKLYTMYTTYHTTLHATPHYKITYHTKLHTTLHTTQHIYIPPHYIHVHVLHQTTCTSHHVIHVVHTTLHHTTYRTTLYHITPITPPLTGKGIINLFPPRGSPLTSINHLVLDKVK